MEKADNFFHNVGVRIFAYLIALFNVFGYVLCDNVIYFVDGVTFMGMRYLIFALILLTAIFNTVYLYVYQLKNGCKIAWLRICYFTSLLLSVILSAVIILELISVHGNMLTVPFLKLLPAILITCAVIVFAYLVLLPKKKFFAIFLAVTLASSVLFGAILPISKDNNFLPELSVIPLKFTSEPVVLDVGDNYSVVWSTNYNSVGSVTYTYDGKEYEIFDLDDGRMVTDKSLHHVLIPKNHISNNVYKVTATRVVRNVAYEPKLGKSVTFTQRLDTPTSNELDITILTDTHNVPESYYDGIRKLDMPNLVIMLGDFANFISYEEDITNYLLRPLSILTQGQIPVIYARGNHETRGQYSTHLADNLGLDFFYYQTTYGNTRFTIVDSNEDKYDDHIEYGGTVDFFNEREKQLEWLAKIKPINGIKDIVICHSPTFFKDEQATRYNDILTNLGVKLCLCGHYHEIILNTLEGQEIEDVTLPTFIGGGLIQNPTFIYNDFGYSTVKITDSQINVVGYTNKKGEIMKGTYFLN